MGLGECEDATRIGICTVHIESIQIQISTAVGSTSCVMSSRTYGSAFSLSI